MVNVALLGAAGGIGQPLALLLKNNTDIKTLNLYDVVPLVKGVAADVSHVCTPAKVTGFTGPEQLFGALKGVDIVVIPAGVPRKPGMTRDDLFNINAGIVRDLCDAAAEVCPTACICIITNPVNSTVPIACEVFKKRGVFNPKHIFGVSTLDVVRANAFVAEAGGVDPTKMNVPVVGGHAGTTIVPLLSQATPKVEIAGEAYTKMVSRIQNAGTEVVEAKAGAGSATLSMAYAGARFVASLTKALKGASEVIECTLVCSKVVSGLDFVAVPVMLGVDGVCEVMGTGPLSQAEFDMLTAAKTELKNSADKGIKFITG